MAQRNHKIAGKGGTLGACTRLLARRDRDAAGDGFHDGEFCWC